MSSFPAFFSVKTFTPKNQAAPDFYLPLLSLSLSLSTFKDLWTSVGRFFEFSKNRQF
jgi:hypothetical protein